MRARMRAMRSHAGRTAQAATVGACSDIGRQRARRQARLQIVVEQRSDVALSSVDNGWHLTPKGSARVQRNPHDAQGLRDD
eukprot:2163564-Rhodomonas_salina.3